MASAAFTASTIFTAVDKFTAPVRQMETATKSFAKSSEVYLSKAERGFRKLTTPLRSLNNMLGGFGVAIGGALIIGAVGNAINTFKDFEQANANLRAVLGANEQQMIALSNSSKLLGSTTSFSASQVSALQTEYAKLGFTTPEILKASEATLSLAAATNTDLAQAAKQTGATLRAFGLDASETQRVVDVFAASTSKSALDMAFLDTAMSKVAPVAKQFNFSLEDSTALLGKLADSGFDASTAATSTRSILLNLADSNGKLAKALGGPVNSLEDLIGGMKTLEGRGVNLAKMLDLTDKQSVAAFATFMSNADAVGGLNQQLKNAGGTAKKMADDQLNTLNGAITMLSSAYEGFILNIEDGNGAIGHNIKRVVQVATEMLSLASGTQVATDKLVGIEIATREYAEMGLTLLKVIGYITGAVIILKGLLLLWRGVMWLVTAAQFAHNVILGISIALQKKSALALVGNTIGYKAYLVAMKLATAANWLFNASNPVGWIIILIGLVVVMIKYWDEWGAALGFILGPIGLIISLFMTFKKNWDLIKKSFEVNGIIGGLKSIGITILDAFLMPIQQLLELIGKLPDWLGGGLAVDASASIQKLRDGLQIGLEENAGERGVVNINNERQKNLVETVNNNQKQSLDVNFNNAPEGTKLTGSGGFAVPKIAPSFNFGS